MPDLLRPALRPVLTPPQRGPLTPVRGVGANPKTILGSALIAWWTADDLASLTLSTSAVTEWRDQVAGYAVRQSGVSALRPVYRATDFNGSPALFFDGSDDFLNMSLSGQFPGGGDGSEIWAIVQQDAAPADTNSRAAVAYGNTVFTSDRRLRRTVQSGVNRGQATVGTGAGTLTPFSTAVDLSSRHLLRAIYGTATTTVEVDGGGAATNSAVPSTTATSLGIGAVPNGSIQQWSGLIRDVLITPLLTTEQTDKLEAWALPRRNL